MGPLCINTRIGGGGEKKKKKKRRGGGGVGGGGGQVTGAGREQGDVPGRADKGSLHARLS